MANERTANPHLALAIQDLRSVQPDHALTPTLFVRRHVQVAITLAETSQRRVSASGAVLAD